MPGINKAMGIVSQSLRRTRPTVPIRETTVTPAMPTVNVTSYPRSSAFTECRPTSRSSVYAGWIT